LVVVAIQLQYSFSMLESEIVVKQAAPKRAGIRPRNRSTSVTCYKYSN
jgi:hypothetical protein